MRTASLNDAERASATEPTAVKTARGTVSKKETAIATEKVDALRRSFPASAEYPAAHVEVAVREQKERRVKMLVRRGACWQFIH